jgi:hypothetical protein
VTAERPDQPNTATRGGPAASSAVGPLNPPAQRSTTNRNGSGPRRALPYNEDLEADLLAAAMQTSDALTVVAELPVDAFYVPGHKLLAEILEHAHRHGWRPDKTFLVDELERMGLLEEAGGSNAVFALWSRAVATGNARRNADRLLELRRERLERTALDGIRARIAEGRVEDLPDELRRVADELDNTATTATTTWQPVDLTAALAGDLELIEPDLLERTDHRRILYRGRIHAFNGESESGKSWLALMAAAEELNGTGIVCYIDLEDHAEGIVSRLRALGVTEHAIREQLVYVRPEEPLVGPAHRSLDAVLAEWQPDLAIIDGVTEAMALHALDPIDNGDVATFWKLLPKRLANTGATVVVIDHVVKNAESRGRYAIGGQHKLAAIDGAAFLVEIETPFGRGRTGRSKITVTKDRPGAIRRHAVAGKVVGHLELASLADDTVRATIIPPDAQRDEWHGPTECMAAILAMFRELPAGEDLSQRQATDQLRAVGLSYRAQTVRDALAVLVRNGDLDERAGPRNSRRYSLHRTDERLDL